MNTLEVGDILEFYIHPEREPKPRYVITEISDDSCIIAHPETSWDKRQMPKWKIYALIDKELIVLIKHNIVKKQIKNLGL